MRKIILLLFIVLSCVTQPFGKNWYVSTTSSGNASGDSWANKIAMQDADETWQNTYVSPGDTVFIDGGSSGILYDNATYANSSSATLSWYKSGTVTDKIIITRDNDDDAHNGPPTLQGVMGVSTPISEGRNGFRSEADYIEISYLGFVVIAGATAMPETNADVSTSRHGIGLGSYPTGIDIFHNEFNWSFGGGIRADFPNDIRIMYNTMRADSTNSRYADDCIYFNGARGGPNSANFEIAYNYILNQNGYDNATPFTHSDILQAPYTQLEGGTSSIHHNFMGLISSSPSSNTAGLYPDNLRGKWQIYDNVIVSIGSIQGFINSGGDIDLTNNTPFVVEFYNNTCYSNLDGAFIFDRCDTLKFKNNIVHQVARTNGMFVNRDLPTTPYYEADYNIYYLHPSFVGQFLYAPTSYNWAQWQSMAGESHSQLTWVDLVDSTSITADGYALVLGSNGIDEGTDLSAYFTTDYRDTVRTGTWDVGAFENVDSSSSNINVKGKVFLQGPFNTNSMMTNLSQNSLLPNTQPFNTAPWNYNGSESLGSGPSSSYVDWVLVELRNSTNPSQVIARTAAILKNDGTLLNTDGSTGVPFNNVQGGTYYIAVFHRNHLPIMSANPVQLSANSPVYDFTDGMNKAYGTNAMANLGDSKFGMYASDGNSNGGITITDRNEIWVPQNGTMGYLKGDFNLDGGVTASDVNLYWNLNNGMMTQVP